MHLAPSSRNIQAHITQTRGKMRKTLTCGFDRTGQSERKTETHVSRVNDIFLAATSLRNSSESTIPWFHARLTKHPVYRAVAYGEYTQREIAVPSRRLSRARAEMRAEKKIARRSGKKRNGRNRRPRSPSRVCLPVVSSRASERGGEIGG